MNVSDQIIARLKQDGIRYHASDNVSAVLEEGDHQKLIEELTVKFEGVLKSLLIDTETDPNSHGTAKRLAKMYVNELFVGRYTPKPPVTSFPNHGDDKYQGMLVARAEIKSMCSHHHQPVKGICYIGLLPSDKVIGLSKYARIAQWCARRGTLQEELTQEILRNIMKDTQSRDVAVHMIAKHGCCENRGIGASNSSTQTTALAGQFFNHAVKHEFFDNIKLQEMTRV